MYYQKHIFFCVNQRENGKACCADHHANEMREYAQQKLKELGIAGAGHFRANKSGCLDRCELGPVLVIYPEGVWYTYESKDDIDEIIKEHVLNGRIVQRLVIDPVE